MLGFLENFFLCLENTSIIKIKLNFERDRFFGNFVGYLLICNKINLKLYFIQKNINISISPDNEIICRFIKVINNRLF